MKTYLSLLKIRLINKLQYRAVTLGEIITNFTWVFMEILVYAAVYRTSKFELPMEFSQTVSYLWMQQILMLLLSVVYADGEIYGTISGGGIAYELVRPINLYGRWFCQATANRIAAVAVNCIPMLIVALICPQPYRMSLPDNFGQIIAFLISTVLALGVVVAFAMLMFITLFYTLAQRGIKVIVTALTSFLSGGVIPLPFFPEKILSVIKLLPFSAMQNMPLLVFSGKVTGVEVVKGILFQVFWLLVLIFVGKSAMKHALKKVIVQGG